MSSKNTSFQLFNLIERLASKGWRGVLEGPRRLQGLFTKVLIIVFGRQTRGHCLAVYAMSREILKIYRKCGPRFVALYLKQSSMLVQKFVGGEKYEHRLLSPQVSLTRSGLPRFIPPEYRKGIRRRDPLIIRTVLTVCALSRLIKVPLKARSRLDTSTIQSDGFELTWDYDVVYKNIVNKASDLIFRYVPMISTIPLELGLVFTPSFSSTPNANLNPFKDSNINFGELIKPVKGVMQRIKMNMYYTLPIDGGLIVMVKHYPLFVGFFMWWSVFFKRRTFVIGFSDKNTLTSTNEESEALLCFLTYLYTPAMKLWYKNIKKPLVIGRIGLKVEGGGKVRPFAICNPILQAFLRPLHDWSMQVLKTLPMDGTYDQLAPLARLKGQKDLFSFDLKAATDLLPITLSRAILENLFGPRFAMAWNSIMSCTPFATPDKFVSKRKRWREVLFTRGQPLGYYSSWSIFTLTHHYLVWLAAEEVYPGRVFRDYAILGDDIVIASPRVAYAYEAIIKRVQGVISKEKSLVSFNGCFEFAKRFVMNNHLPNRSEASPISLACIRMCRGFVSPTVFKMFGVSLRSSVRLRGGGYRTFSRFMDNKIPNFNKLSLRWKRHVLTFYAPSGPKPLPFLLWLAFPSLGILNCYIIGQVRQRILELVKPKDLIEHSFDVLDLFWEGDDFEIKEKVLGPFIQLHLKYLKWYWERYLDYSIPLDELIEPPISPRKLERESDEAIFVRYGLIFKLWDYVQRLVLVKPNIFPYTFIPVEEVIYAHPLGMAVTESLSPLASDKPRPNISI